MFLIATICGYALLACAVFQATYFVIYRWKVLRTSNVEINPEFVPRTAVVLCLRGPDPSIRDCLNSLLSQSYSNFELHLVADCSDDPALAIARSVLENFDSNSEQIESHFHVLPKPEATCSLKCSALVHAVSQLPESVTVVVSVDADAILTPTWLATLIAPLENSQVGVSTGNRWFNIAANSGIGSSVRASWNAAAVVQMYLYSIPWGGSLAIRRDVIEEAELLQQWSNAFCEDTLLTNALKKLDLVVARPVEIVVVNDESISCQNAFNWIRRQLLTVRLHHPSWPFVLAHGLTVGFPFVCLDVLLFSLFVGNSHAAIVLIGSVVIFELASLLLLFGIHNTNQILLRRAGSERPTEKFNWLRTAIALPVTQVVHFFATFSAAFATEVSWRQIDYKIGKSKIELVKYQPFVAENSSGEVEPHSID